MSKRMSSCLTACGLMLGVVGCTGAQAASEVPLQSMSKLIAVASAGAWQTVGEGGSTWRLSALVDAEGASVKLSPDQGKTWDLSPFARVTLNVRNVGASPITVRASITNPDAKDLAGTCQTAATLMPGQSQTLDLRIMPTPEDPGYDVFKPFFKYYSQVSVRDNTVDATKIDGLKIWLDSPKEGDSVEVSKLQLEGTGTKGPVPFFPFVDKYGQYMHADWPGKIHSDEDFAVQLAEEEKERTNWPGPKDWNKYGGWATGPQLQATGFFRVTKHEGKWWLVDPEGKLFWSHGATGAGFGPDSTPITGREHWFAELPARDSPLGKFYKTGNRILYMYYAGKDWEGFQFSLANAELKYGGNAETQLTQVTSQRLRSWGLNTMGAWSSAPMMASGLTPYTTVVHYGSPMVNPHMPDVFDPDWEVKVRERLQRERDTTAKDPMNIGYFIDNERKWGRFPRFAGVALQVLEAAPTVRAKILFIDELKAKYGTIDKLNESWASTHASWDALLNNREKLSFDEPKRPNMQADCGDFGMKFGEKYFSTCRKLVKEVAPNHMYMGARLHSHVDKSLIELQTKHCDVISYNMYDVTPEGRMKQYADIDHPFLITEWGIDNDPRQSPFRADKVEVAIGRKGARTEFLSRFIDSGIAHPKIVGIHFFQYRDQPISGRPDGEALLRGFLNATDTPNFELIQVNRKLTYDLYKKRTQAK
jgi:hypothetical protein